MKRAILCLLIVCGVCRADLYRRFANRNVFGDDFTIINSLLSVSDTQAALDLTPTTWEFKVVSESASPQIGAIAIREHQENSGNFYSAKARGTSASPDYCNLNDELGSYNCLTYDVAGNSWDTSGRLIWIADEAHAEDAHGARMELRLTPNSDAENYVTRFTIKNDGDVGWGTDTDPNSLMEFFSATPYLWLHNTTAEDGDYGREGRISWVGEQSGGELSTLGEIEIAHDGTSDDTKGIFTLALNNGTTLTDYLTILSSGALGLGTTAPSGEMSIVTETGFTQFYMYSYQNDNTKNTNLGFFKAGGTEASPTVVAANEEVADITGYGYDGDSFEQCARIAFNIDGAIGDGDMPGRIEFQVSPDGSSTLVEAARFNNAGDLLINTTTSPTNGGGMILFGNVDANSITIGDAQAGLYADDDGISGELIVIDEADNATTVSPHGPWPDNMVVSDRYPRVQRDENKHLILAELQDANDPNTVYGTRRRIAWGKIAEIVEAYAKQEGIIEKDQCLISFEPIPGERWDEKEQQRVNAAIKQVDLRIDAELAALSDMLASDPNQVRLDEIKANISSLVVARANIVPSEAPQWLSARTNGDVEVKQITIPEGRDVSGIIAGLLAGAAAGGGSTLIRRKKT